MASVEEDPIPPIPQVQPPIDESNSARKRFTPTWMNWFDKVRTKINIINALLVGFSKITGIGFPALGPGGVWTVRTMQGPMSVQIVNGDGSLGDPTFTFVNDELAPNNLSAYGVDHLGVKRWFRPPLFESTGVLEGGTLAVNAGDNTKFDIGAVIVGWSDYDTNPVSPTRAISVRAAELAVAVPSLAVIATYVGISMPSSTVVMQSSPFTAAQQRDIAPLGAVISNGVNLIAVNNLPSVLRAGINQVQDLMLAVGPMNLSGNKITPDGANLQIDKSAGMIFKQGSNFSIDENNPHGLTLAALNNANFNYRLSTGTQFAVTNAIDPNNYENPIGVLTPIPGANRFTIQRLYIFTSNLIRIQYGQFEYISMAAAESALATEEFVTEQNIAENGILLAFLILRDGTVALNNPSDAKIVLAGKFGGPVGAGGTTIANTDALPEGVVNLYFTDERAQDAVGSIFVDSASINFTYDDVANTITAVVVGGAAGTVTSVAATAPPAGISITGSPITTAGTFVFTLTNDLLALENLGAQGFAVRTAADTWAQRNIVGTAGRVTVSNGDGVASSPVINVDPTLDAGFVHIAGTETITGDKTFQAPTLFQSAVFITPLAGSSALVLSAAAGQADSIYWRTGGSTRWIMEKNNTAEGGGTTGSDWVLDAYDDTGTFWLRAMKVSRLNASVEFGSYISVTGPSGGVQWRDRTLPGPTWISYATGGIWRLFNGTDRFTVDDTYVGTYAGAVSGKGMIVGADVGFTAFYYLATGGYAAANIRWGLMKNTGLETGGNVGSDLGLRSFSDTGVALGDAFVARRATQVMEFAFTPQVGIGAGQPMWHNGNMPFSEGTFVPVVVGSVTAGVGTYVTQTGQYTKVGNAIHFKLAVSITAHTGTGNLRIAGLPFTAGGSNSPVTIGLFAGLTLPANFALCCDVLSGTNQVRPLIYSTAGGSIGSIGLTLDPVFDMQVAGTYYQ